MALTPINIGAAPNDGTGESLRAGGATINANFVDLDHLVYLTKSANYTLVNADNRRVVRCTADLTLSLPVGLTAGHSNVVVITGVTTVTIAPSGGATATPGSVTLVNPSADTITVAVVMHEGGNAWLISAATAGVVGINPQTGTTYTYALSDVGVLVTHDNGSAITATLPTNASVPIPVGGVIAVAQLGDGLLTLEGASGVTVNGTSGGSVAMAGRWKTATAVKLATDTWLVSGGTA